MPISWYAPRNRRKKRAKGLAPWNPSAATVLKTAAVDAVSLSQTPDRQNSGGRVAEGKRTEHFY